MADLKVGVLGAGSIGCYVGARLAAADVARVVLVGRTWLRDEVDAYGLHPVDPDGPEVRVPADRVRVTLEAADLHDCDVVLLCTKSAQTEGAAASLARLGRPGVVVSLQNGVRNPEVLRAALPGWEVVAGIVGFNVVGQGQGRFVRATSGPLQLQGGASTPPIATALRGAGLQVEVHDDLAPHAWTKLLVNLNNAVSALSGAPTVALLASPGYRRVIAALMHEALGVLRAAGIRPARLRGVPVGWMPTVLRWPTPLVRLVTRRQMRVDPEARSSMYDDLRRGRPTEVDVLNGEIVRLAARTGVPAPRNTRIVARVRAAEAQGAGSPELSPEALWAVIAEDG